MNILTDILPEKVRANNTVFEIDTDFRASISFALMVETGEKDTKKLLSPFYPQGIPTDLEGATTAALWFYHGGKIATDKEQNTNEKPTYSFDIDAESIFSDFWRFYHVDLTQENLHWWTFRGLLVGLPEDSNFKQRIYYRTCKLSDLTKKERERIAKIRKQIEIKQNTNGKMSLEERNAQMKAWVLKRNKELQSEVKT